ncbi:hypothetical protein GCM10009111_06340 [Colwellia asteriadis]|uniref:Uncharacterized protein n=1 Tax=Colwellia asteriadis TaxID=517723 RepID=A0ABN1L3S1_9GAMM
MFSFISTLLLAGFWFLLAEGDLASLLVGIVFIPLSVFVLVKLSEKANTARSGARLQFIKIPKFVGFFLYQSIKGGKDTALRAFSLNMQLQPEFVHYPIKHIPAGLPMNLFMNVVSLLPGSVGVIREPNSVLVHVLAVTDQTLNEIYACELIVSELFGLDVSAPKRNPITKKAT